MMIYPAQIKYSGQLFLNLSLKKQTIQRMIVKNTGMAPTIFPTATIDIALNKDDRHLKIMILCFLVTQADA